MEIARTEDYILMRLSHGEDIIKSIEEVIADEKSTLLIVTGIGMIRDFELGYFDNGQYIKRSFKEPHELTMLQGSVATEGEPRMHIHAMVADKDHRAFGGHLLKGWVWMSNEIGLLKLKGVSSKRWMDSEKKVAILHVSQATG
jgi:predicted DNA-binding protein with PD1-like motif